MKFPVTLILSGIFIAYILHSIWSIAQLFIPPACSPGAPGQTCIPAFLAAKPRLEMYAFTSVRRSPTTSNEVKLLYENLEFNCNEPMEKAINLVVPESVRRNGSLYLHVWVAAATWGKAAEREGKQHTSDVWDTLMQDPFAVHAMAKITQYKPPEAASFTLLGDDKRSKPAQSPIDKNTPIVHLKPRLEMAMLSDIASLPARGMPVELAYLIRLAPDGTFLPILTYNMLSSRMSDLVAVTKDLYEFNMTLAYAPVGIGKLRLWLHLENGMRSLKEFGFTAKDVDDVKGIFADTNIYLLCTTIFVAALHLLFDFLALKNDVSFWHHTRSLVGLSKRTVLWRAFSQAVVFLYLMDENTSMLVLVPAGLTALVEMWKVKKCLRLRFSWSGVKQEVAGLGESRTQQFDQQCMTYLQYILWPLCIAGAIYSLLYEPHKGWYSWTVHSMVRGVYAFGFLFMLPQLFINYKLRSVAHLPWRAFMYKAFNTFIDDLFAFTISMPTAHRVACFRDDAVFLVYLYQRWLYPVDKSRKDGDGAHEEDVGQHEKSD